ncbi:MAG: outer membrane protein transport protein [bacterium]|nr:outer membrane protein transport protein [bacterium]
MKKDSLAFTVLLYIFAMTVLSPAAHGAGFAIFTQGAAELAQGNSVIAHTEGPASLFFNPALIGKLDGTQAQIGTSMLSPIIKYDSDTPGEDSKTKNMDCFLSTIYLTHKYSEKFSAGLGLFTPFGLGTKWHSDWEGRYIVTESEMTTLDINPALSYKAGPKLSLAAGLNVMLLNTRKENKINQSPNTDGEQKFEGDGDGLGYNIGLLYEINDELTMGASYRSSIDVDIAGKVSFDVATSLAAFFPNTDAEAEITLPAQAHFGLSYRGSQDFQLEAALRWVGWSVYDKVTTKFDKVVPALGDNKITEVNKWKDTLAFKLGGRYRLSEDTALFAGYQYEKGASPDETFYPGTPDSDSYAISIGSATRHRNFNIKLAYAYKKFEDRQINNNVGAPSGTADGEYEADMHTVAASLTYSY